MRERGREGGREGGRERGREGERERSVHVYVRCFSYSFKLCVTLFQSLPLTSNNGQ